MKIFKIVFAFIIALLAWEFFLRTTLWLQPQYVVYPKGVVAVEGSYSVRSQEGYSRRHHVNQFGTFHPIRKDLPMIVFQGDSYTYAEQVEAEENYSSIVRRQFAEKYEILNAGNFGMNVAHYVYNERYFKELNPVYHIIQIKFDDFFDSFGLQEPLHFKKNGETLEFEIYRTPFMSWVGDHIEIYNFLNRISTLSYFRDKYLQDINAWVKSFGKKHNDVPVSQEAPIISKTEMEAERIEKIKLQLKELKKTYGSRFALLYLPKNPVMKNKILVMDDPEEVFYNENIARLCREMDIPLISMWDSFRDSFVLRNELAYGFSNSIPGTGHTNVIGHQLIAQKITEFLTQKAPN